jgi:hypothetical protein
VMKLTFINITVTGTSLGTLGSISTMLNQSDEPVDGLSTELYVDDLRTRHGTRESSHPSCVSFINDSSVFNNSRAVDAALPRILGGTN